MDCDEISGETPRKITLLIADDHDLLRGAIRTAFEECEDIEVIAEAGDGLEAVRLCLELRPDVVLMDIKMPKLNGVEATKKIHMECADTAVVILTGYDDDSYVSGLLEAGAAGYLLKTTDAVGLVRAVRAIADGEAVLTSSVFAKIRPRRTLHVEKRIDADHDEYSESLSPRELEVIRLLASGMSNKEISGRLCITISTTKAHVTNIFEKMHVSSRGEAIIKAMRLGLVREDDLAQRG